MLGIAAPTTLSAQQPFETVPSRGIAPRAVGCDGGLVNDDGTWESGVSAATMVTRFGPLADPAELESACICWSTLSPTRDIEYDLVLFSADGPGGEPGTELARVPVSAAGVTPERRFFQHDLSSLGIEVPEQPFYLGVATDWVSSEAFLCYDIDGPNDPPDYTFSLTNGWREDEDAAAYGIRAGLAGDGPPPPPGPPVVDSHYPDFRFWVRITGQSPILGSREPACIDETVCFSGALPGRSEVFVRIVGPKPNGKLWPTLVKFSTSRVEVWIEQVSTGQLRYYLLEGASPGFDELPGLFDRDGFEP